MHITGVNEHTNRRRTTSGPSPTPALHIRRHRLQSRSHGPQPRRARHLGGRRQRSPATRRWWRCAGCYTRTSGAWRIRLAVSTGALISSNANQRSRLCRHEPVGIRSLPARPASTRSWCGDRRPARHSQRRRGCRRRDAQHPQILPHPRRSLSAARARHPRLRRNDVVSPDRDRRRRHRPGGDVPHGARPRLGGHDRPPPDVRANRSRHSHLRSGVGRHPLRRTRADDRPDRCERARRSAVHLAGLRARASTPRSVSRT